mmetsp:Transcript_20993/g.58227  ORF Transcript_20993/g.58227 Transcript_20993/m.58227 type:complete len:205 (+) Transcript_20993:91-705(+)
MKAPNNSCSCKREVGSYMPRLEGLKTWKPSSAVLVMSPGMCRCQCSSLTLVCPACTNKSCGGMSAGVVALLPSAAMSAAMAASSSGSLSSARSQTMVSLSTEVVASMEDSWGHHSTLVTAALWCLKCATNSEGLKLRRSQMRSVPSSPPDASMYEVEWFHDTTFTSASCARTFSIGSVRCRRSHTKMCLSTLEEMNTSGSVGLH